LQFKTIKAPLIQNIQIPSTEFKSSLSYIRRFKFLILGILLATNGLAQLQAAFTINKDGGCKPHTVQFTNTTTGTVAGVTYSWDLGNGNTSALVSPGATYVEEKVYTITLTAKQGNVTSSVSKQVTVYKTPSLDFSATPTKGCMPLEVAFKANATAGDGSITRYLWDFGDGQTADGAAITTPNHTYTFAQQAPVSLTVTNSFGCFNTRTYSGMIDVYQSVKVDFTMNPVRTCTPADTVYFQNKSQAPNGTTWLWDFGDGKTSTSQSPKHVYEKDGNYLVKLTSTSTNGCTNSKLSDTLRVGNIQLDFPLPEAICQWNWQELTHNIQPPYKEIRWFVNEEQVYIDLEGRAKYYGQNPGKYPVRLEVDFGNCVVKRTKELIINPIVTPYSFSKKKLNYCTIPAEFEFSDTSGLGVKWNWTVNFNNPAVGTEKTLRHKFTDSSGNGWVVLEVTTDKGCTTKLQDSVIYTPIKYHIDSRTTEYVSPLYACEGEEHQFWAVNRFSIPRDIVKYNWDFGDGGTSTNESPYYRYKDKGAYKVTLRYETIDGCNYTILYNRKIIIKEKPEASLEVIGGNVVCGNSPTFFKITSNKPITSKWVYFDNPENTWDLSNNPEFRDYDYTYKFFREGPFTATLIVGSEGCRDTVVYKDILTVVPPFTNIERPVNTCFGDRLTVGFTDSSRGATKWKWEFGDGSSKEFTSKQDKVFHTFKDNGQYQARLTTYAGNCAVTDSIVFYVLKKQNPVLDFAKDRVCLDSLIRFTYTGFESNPSYSIWVGEPDYEVWGGQYSDSTFPRKEAYLSGEFLTYLDPGKNGMRLFFRSRYFECYDTTNFSNVEIRGPIANFETPREDGYCVWETIKLADSSIAFPGVPITKWRWDIGNIGPYANLGTYSDGFKHKFNTSIHNVLYLDVVDAEGCSNYMVKPLKVNGPKSEFVASAENVAIGTTVQFTNITDYSNSYSAYPQWILPDGSKTQNYNESFTFDEEGEYYVKLFHENYDNVCRDTIVRKIIVRKVNARFTTSISYVNNNGCPPAIARFTSTATNATRLGWNFGDGSIGGDQKVVTHTYNQPGIFQVWHYSYDENDNVDSSFDFIEIKGPYALISANRLSACNNLQVTLNAEVKKADSYTWDFGDGTISSLTNKTVTHQYLTAGLYMPSLILEDAKGCKATSVLPEKIIVDSLNADFVYAPLRICAETEVAFTGQSASFSKSRLNADLQYKWSVTNVLVGNDKDVAYAFNTAGDYKVAYEVESTYGCKVSVTKNLKIEPPLNAAIAGPAAICKGDTASFSASALGSGLAWRWNVPGQPAVTVAVTPAVRWNTPGVFSISLLADNGACTDSIVHMLTVNDLPAVTISPANERACLGDTLNLTLQGNGLNTWEVHPALNQTGNNLARVWPSKNALFRVQSVSAFGCKSTDSIRVTVVQPFAMQVVTTAEACLGKPVTLSASGASNYQWVPAQGLSGSTIANPIANITTSTSYRVVGSDAFGCFRDSANVQVTIHPLPQVNAGTNLSVPGGQTINLSATSSLPNVTWNWNPATYLTCTNCAAPASRPLRDITYTVKATTTQGCAASDTIQITVLCSAESIFIPNAFTPNGDGLNERFGVLGAGFSLIKFFRISDRWGKVVFERRDVLPTDVSAYWTGSYPDGSPAVSGSYIYSIQVECATGLLFDYKGAVSLIR